MVPKAGLEPAQLAPLPPQGSVYTNFTTSANDRFRVLSPEFHYPLWEMQQAALSLTIHPDL